MCRTSKFHVILGTIAFLTAVGLAHAQKPLDGGAKVQPIAVYASSEPLPKPERAVIYTFVLPPDVITPDRPAASAEQQAAVASEDADASSSENLAGAVQASFSKALVDELQKAHVFAEPAAQGDVAPPLSLVVRGSFAPVARRKSKRPLMGLGRGAADVQLDVSVSLLTKAKPVLVSEFYFQLGNGKKGASGRLQTSTVANGTEPNTEETSDAVQADASRIAKELAAQIEKIMAAQQWLAPPETASK
jgi:hypothetical protein